MTGKCTIYSMIMVMTLGGFCDVTLAQSKSKNKPQANSYPAKQQAVRRVKSETGGRVLDIKQLSSQQGKIWRVKFLKDGKIQYMDVVP